jgi:hypothetical protein
MSIFDAVANARCRAAERDAEAVLVEAPRSVRLVLEYRFWRFLHVQGADRALTGRDRWTTSKGT